MIFLLRALSLFHFTRYLFLLDDTSCPKTRKKFTSWGSRNGLVGTQQRGRMGLCSDIIFSTSSLLTLLPYDCIVCCLFTFLSPSEHHSALPAFCSCFNGCLADFWHTSGPKNHGIPLAYSSFTPCSQSITRFYGLCNQNISESAASLVFV